MMVDWPTLAEDKNDAEILRLYHGLSPKMQNNVREIMELTQTDCKEPKTEYEVLPKRKTIMILQDQAAMACIDGSKKTYTKKNYINALLTAASMCEKVGDDEWTKK